MPLSGHGIRLRVKCISRPQAVGGRVSSCASSNILGASSARVLHNHVVVNTPNFIGINTLTLVGLEGR